MFPYSDQEPKNAGTLRMLKRQNGRSTSRKGLGKNEETSFLWGRIMLETYRKIRNLDRIGQYQVMRKL
jgi:hypothetical protein